MYDVYKEFLNSIFGVAEIEKYIRLSAIIQQAELEDYSFRFEEIVAHSDVADVNQLRDEWHEASFTILRMLLKGVGVIPSTDAEFVPLLNITEVLFSIEYREDKSSVQDILQDADLDNTAKLIQVIEFFSDIEYADIAVHIAAVHNGCINALAMMAASGVRVVDDVENNPLPPLAKNIRLLINENPNFLILNEAKAGLMLGLDVSVYIERFWDRLSKLEQKDMLRELSAIMLISNTPPHEMMDRLRKVLTDHYTDSATIRQLNMLITGIFAPVLLQKVET